MFAVSLLQAGVYGEGDAQVKKNLYPPQKEIKQNRNRPLDTENKLTVAQEVGSREMGGKGDAKYLKRMKEEKRKAF